MSDCFGSRRVQCTSYWKLHPIAEPAKSWPQTERTRETGSGFLSDDGDDNPPKKDREDSSLDVTHCCIAGMGLVASRLGAALIFIFIFFIFLSRTNWSWTFWKAWRRHREQRAGNCWMSLSKVVSHPSCEAVSIKARGGKSVNVEVVCRCW